MDNTFTNLFYFEHVSGGQLYPVKVKNRDTGKVAYRLSAGGVGGNKKEVSIEIDSEQQMKKMVLEEGFAIRAASKDRKRNGLYKLGMRSINRAVRF